MQKDEQKIMPWDLHRLLDRPGVAELLGCSPATVTRLADAGRMPRPIKLGWLVRWDPKVIQEWVAAGCPRTRDMARKGGAR